MFKEKFSPEEHQADWKAQGVGSESVELSAEAAALTPEDLIKGIPERDRGALEKLGTKILGEKAVADIVEGIKNQADLWDYTQANAFRTGRTEDPKTGKALWHAAQATAIIFAFVHELSSPNEVGATEVQNHHNELMGAMDHNLPHLEDGSRVSFEDFTDSQKQAAGLAYSLEKTYEARGGSPADYAIQVEDIWGVQEYFKSINFAHEESRAEEVAKWGKRVTQQYEQERDLEESEKSVLDTAMGVVGEMNGVSALEKVAFKDAALRAIHENRGGDPEALVAILKDLVAATEFVQTKTFANYDSDVKVLEGLLANILENSLSSHENTTGNSEGAKEHITTPKTKGNDLTGDWSSHESKIDYPSNLGIEIPQVHLEFGGQYSQSEQTEIQNYVDRILETAKATDHQFKSYEEKYGSMSNFGSFRQEVSKYIKDELARVNEIIRSVSGTGEGRITVDGNYQMSPEDVADQILDVLSTKAKLGY
ncbi:MAG: hypothetical protein AAB501_01985 [Patescibacteria group bacterium]